MQEKQVVLPNYPQYEVLKEFNTFLDYPENAMVLHAISHRYVLADMQPYIQDYCVHCDNCLRNKASHVQGRQLQPCQLDELKPRNIDAFDVTVLPWVTKNWQCFLLIVDLFSKYS